MKMYKRHNFKNLKIWNQSMEIAADVNGAVKDWPREERFELTSQAIRSAYSIPSNIAEGSAKSSRKDFRRFLEISLGSCYELETQLILAARFKYGNTEKINSILESLSEEQRMILGMIERLAKEINQSS